MTRREEKLKMLAPALVPWFLKNKRSMPWRDDPTPYHVWLSEIMLQQTRIEAAKPYYLRFLREIPDIASLAAADPEKLHKLWEGLGYYSRVKNLQAAAKQIMEDCGGKFPEEPEKIRKLKGIGDYTTGAIASICFDEPVPAVDGNVLRVLSRITGDTRPVTDERTRKEIRAELAGVYPAHDRGAFTQGLMELGEVICIPNGEPDCKNCPCVGFCASKDGNWRSLPVKAPKKERRKEQMTVFLLQCGTKLALHKRGETGLLSGLWEFPNVPGALTAEKALTQVKAWGCKPKESSRQQDSCRKKSCVNRNCGDDDLSRRDERQYPAIKEEKPRTHIFTHVEWDMKCFRANCTEMPERFTWAEIEEIRGQYALPTAFRKFL